MVTAETNLLVIIKISLSAKINIAKINLFKVFEMRKLKKLSYFDTSSLLGVQLYVAC